MDKQFSQESKHLIRFLHQEEQSLKPICIAFYRKQYSLVMSSANEVSSGECSFMRIEYQYLL